MMDSFRFLLKKTTNLKRFNYIEHNPYSRNTCTLSMDPTSANLSHLIFGPGPRGGDGGLRSQAEGIVEKLTVYTWPVGPRSNDASLAVMAYFTAYGRSESVSPSSWATWAFSYIMLAFPEMQVVAKTQNEREYQFKPLPRDFVAALVAVSAAAEDYDDDNPEAYREVVRLIPSLTGLPSVPVNEEFFPAQLAASATVQAVYGFTSLLIFLAGKKIDDKNASTITERRPSNLINAYQIPEPATFFLTGEGKMSPEAHRYVNQAWVTYAHMRTAVISEAARFSVGTSLPQRVTFTIVKLIEYAGMQQATFIHEFLQAMPQCVNYACIRPSLNAYTTSLREVAATPGYLQPYFKVINGERTRAFHRNSILVLSSCATAYKKYTTPSMKNFNLGEGATQAVNMYDAEAARRGHSTLQGLATPATEDNDIE